MKRLIVSTVCIAAAALSASLQPAQSAPIYLGYADGVVAVHYNNATEIPANQSYLRAQFSSANLNGGYFQFDNSDLGGFSWNSIFSGQPVGSSQFGFAFVLPSPTDTTGTIPTLNAYDNVNNSAAGRASAGQVDWTIGDYKDGSGGAGNPANVDINSIFRGGNGSGGSVSATYTLTPLGGGSFKMDVTGTLMTDGFIHWYNPALGQADLTAWGLQDYLSFQGSYIYTKGADTTLGIDYYEGRTAFYVHTTPDPGTTLGLLGFAVAGLGVLRRKLRA